MNFFVCIQNDSKGNGQKNRESKGVGGLIFPPKPYFVLPHIALKAYEAMIAKSEQPIALPSVMECSSCCMGSSSS